MKQLAENIFLDYTEYSVQCIQFKYNVKKYYLTLSGILKLKQHI